MGWTAHWICKVVWLDSPFHGWGCFKRWAGKPMKLKNNNMTICQKTHISRKNKKKSHEIPWCPMKSHDIPWNPMKSHDVPWNPMKSHDVPWNPMKSHEITWNLMKSHEVKEKSNKTVFLRSFWAGKPLRICLNKHILGWIAFSNSFDVKFVTHSLGWIAFTILLNLGWIAFQKVCKACVVHFGLDSL